MDWCVAAGAVPVTFVALPVDGVCRTTAGFLGVFVGVAAGAAGCGLGVDGATGAVAGAGLTGNIPGEDSGVAGATSVLTGMSALTASG